MATPAKENAYQAVAQNDDEVEAAEEPVRVDLDWRKDDGLVMETRCDINGQRGRVVVA